MRPFSCSCWIGGYLGFTQTARSDQGLVDFVAESGHLLFVYQTECTSRAAFLAAEFGDHQLVDWPIIGSLTAEWRSLMSSIFFDGYYCHGCLRYGHGNLIFCIHRCRSCSKAVVFISHPRRIWKASYIVKWVTFPSCEPSLSWSLVVAVTGAAFCGICLHETVTLSIFVLQSRKFLLSVLAKFSKLPIWCHADDLWFWSTRTRQNWSSV